MWTRRELSIFHRLRTPEQIQVFLDERIIYNTAAASCYSPRLVLRHRRAHCLEGALFAACALERLGHEPMLLDLEAVRDDDHVVALFRHGDCWGAIGKSNYAGLRFRTPVYRTLRELAMSYFDHYYNPRGEKSLRAFAGPVRLKRFDRIHWRTAPREVWEVAEYLVQIRHFPVLPPPMRAKRFWMDRRSYEAGKYGAALAK
jgi:hypothetical protein